jgi:glycosyltransferase involved in cell wall biosynthesis
MTTKNQPLVSVLMTVYNRERYIADAIESVISSTYQNWELVIVDDRSKDNSVNIARSYQQKDDRIKVYINEQNLGDYPNRNKAASYAKGKYLKYLDSDDLIYPHGLEVMVQAMELSPTIALGVNSSKPELLKPYPVVVKSEQVYKQQFLGNGFFFTGPTGTIIRRDIFEKLGGLCNTRYTGDFDSWLKFSQKYDTVIFQPGLIWWRQHDDQEYNKGQDLDKYFKSTNEIQQKYLNDNNSPLTSNERKEALQTLKQRQARMFWAHLILKRNPHYAYHYYKNSCLSFTDLLLGFKKSKIIYNFEKDI